MNSEQLSQSEPISCRFPSNTASTGGAYGCKCDRCRAAKNAHQREYRKRHYRECKERDISYRHKLKTDLFNAYGGCICRCCGETELKFLSLDHIFNDGAKDHYYQNGRRSGTTLYGKLKKEGYPDKQRFQVLCMNCNFGKKINNGVCPHEDSKANA